MALIWTLALASRPRRAVRRHRAPMAGWWMAVFSAGGMVAALTLLGRGDAVDAAGLVSATTLLLAAAVLHAANGIEMC